MQRTKQRLPARSHRAHRRRSTLPATPAFRLRHSTFLSYSDAPYETAEVMTVNAAATTNWTVVRGVDGTTAAASVPAGATVAGNPQPVTGSLVDKPIKVGER